METKKYLDFHMHTYYSDGIATPTDAVKTARFNDLDYIAITDHDNLRGIEEAIQAGKKYEVEVIPGVEITTNKYHILGLGVNTDKDFWQYIQFSAEEQRKVCKRKVETLQRKGVPINMKKIETLFPKSRLGKMNILYTMAQDEECRKYFKQTYGRKIDTRFYGELIQGKRISDKETLITAKEAIKQIHNAGGLAFIAHPFKDIGLLEELDILLTEGLEGVEIQPNFNGKNDIIRKYALEKNILVTYGSDWHGGLFGRNMLTTGGENIMDEKLRRALKLEEEQNA